MIKAPIVGFGAEGIRHVRSWGQRAGCYGCLKAVPLGFLNSRGFREHYLQTCIHLGCKAASKDMRVCVGAYVCLFLCACVHVCIFIHIINVHICFMSTCNVACIASVLWASSAHVHASILACVYLCMFVTLSSTKP